MLLLGSHVSFQKKDQLLGSTKEAISYGASVFMFYTGAPQNTTRSVIDDGKTIEALALMKEAGMDYRKVIVHAPYIINLANRSNHEFSIRFLTDELERCQNLGIGYIVLHPGSHVGVGEEVGIQNIIDGLNQVFLSATGSVMILLETMAGKGTELGRNFEQIHQIIKGVKQNEKMGVCLDTCHLHDAGYDLNNFDHILEEFDQTIGLDRLHCIHINDSKNVKNSHKDRHENFGFGTIGFDTLLKIVYHKKLTEIPKILETPYINREYAPYQYEIEMIKKQEWNPNLLQQIEADALKK